MNITSLLSCKVRFLSMHTQVIQIPATSLSTLLDISQPVECLNSSGRLIQPWGSVWHLLILTVVKRKRVMMSSLHRKSVLELVFIKVID